MAVIRYQLSIWLAWGFQLSFHPTSSILPSLRWDSSLSRQWNRISRPAGFNTRSFIHAAASMISTDCFIETSGVCSNIRAMEIQGNIRDLRAMYDPIEAAYSCSFGNYTIGIRMPREKPRSSFSGLPNLTLDWQYTSSHKCPGFSLQPRR